MITQRQLLEHVQRAWALIDTQEKWEATTSLTALMNTGPNEQSHRIVLEVKILTGMPIGDWEVLQRNSRTADGAYVAVQILWAKMLGTYEFNARVEEQGPEEGTI